MITVQDVQTAKRRDDLVPGYRDAVLASFAGRSVPIADVNHAIIARWSLSALKHIKQKAWAEATRRAKRATA